MQRPRTSGSVALSAGSRRRRACALLSLLILGSLTAAAAGCDVFRSTFDLLCPGVECPDSIAQGKDAAAGVASQPDAGRCAGSQPTGLAWTATRASVAP